MFNLSATLNVSRLLLNPSLCLPHLTVKTFDSLKFPISIPGNDKFTIRALVLDKDNCFAQDHDDKVWPAYNNTWKRMLESHSPEHILIVSNSAGTMDDLNHEQALLLEKNTGVKVLIHGIKKPGCHKEIMDYFREKGIENPSEIAVIGDRLFTDMLMANMMGSWGVWISEGVSLSEKMFPRLERALYSRIHSTYMPPSPSDN